MPLSNAIEREPIHTRRLELTAYRRPDGQYDIEGHLLDTKPFQYDMIDRSRAPFEPIHDMLLRLTVDSAMTISDAEAVMDVGAHAICHQVTPNFRRLIGLTIGPGWNRAIRERLGGGEGCTHLNEMLAQMATTAMQAIWAEHEMAAQAAGESPPLADGVLNACYTYRPDSSYVRDYFPAQYVPNRDETPR